MKHLITFFTSLVLWATHAAAWAQIYETTDTEGNPVFTDAPVDASSSAVELPRTNISDAPAPASAGETSGASPAGQKAAGHPPGTERVPDPDADLYKDRVRAERREEEGFPPVPTPHEELVGEEPQGTMDGEAPHETEGGAMPHETEGGAMPHETEGGAMPHETEGGAMPHETEGGEMPQEVGDF